MNSAKPVLMTTSEILIPDCTIESIRDNYWIVIRLPWGKVEMVTEFDADEHLEVGQAVDLWVS